MSHAAALSGKYEIVLYNDFNPLIVDYLRRTLKGEFRLDKFKPEFISREQFFDLKDKDGYIKYCWSFGNNGKDYLYGKQIEKIKEEAHNLVVFGKRSEMLETIAPRITDMITALDIPTRRRQYMAAVRDKRYNLQCLEHLERLERLERLEITCTSYQDYEYQDGDIVYLDPPYEGTEGYDAEFNHAEFYGWVHSRPYQVWFSSYGGLDFPRVWEKAVQKQMCIHVTGQDYAVECLYTNRP